jgi:hypothetical protein
MCDGRESGDLFEHVWEATFSLELVEGLGGFFITRLHHVKSGWNTMMMMMMMKSHI